MSPAKLAKSMKVKNNQESGTAGKPGEGPVNGHRVGAPEGSPKAKETNLRSAEGVASLLKSEFAAEPAEEVAPGTEVQPGHDRAAESSTDVTSTAGSEVALSVSAAGAAGASATQGTDGEAGRENGEVEASAEAGAEGEAGDAQAAAGEADGAADLPPELQAAVESWEEQGRGELPPVLQALVDRRIHKLTAQRESEKSGRAAAEAKVAELTNEVAQLRAGGGAAAEPLPTLDGKELDRQQTTYERFLADAENYLDDTATDDERGRIERYLQSNRMDASGLKRQVREVNRALQQLPAQRQQLAAFKKAEASAEPEAKRFFPWLDDKSSPEYQQAQAVFDSIPDLKQRTPFHRVVLGVYVLGLKQYAALRAAGANGNGKARVGVAGAGKVPVVKAPPKVPAAGAAAPSAARNHGAKAQEDAARQSFNRRPTAEGAAELFKLGLRA
jgi:hypothetical protein